jgi:amino acid adenylation domain-containing protein
LEQVLEGMLGDENRRILDLQLMSDVEWREVVVEWNQTAAQYPRDKCLHEIIEEQVERTPETVAAVYEGAQVTYEELNRRANQVGDYLRRTGVGPETVVAVGAERGLGFLISMLGVFKAGGTYLPLDLWLPATRLQHSLAESKARLVLTTRESAAVLEWVISSARCEVPIAAVEEIQECGEYHTENLPRRSYPNNLAYVIYTSGSTGSPKGAMVEQDGMMNHLFAKVRDLAFTGQDIIAQTASQAFDISVWQFLISLLAGGRVVIVSDEKAHDPVKLIKLLQDEQVTVAEAVPSLLPALLAELTKSGTSNSAAALRWMLVTGEAFPSELCRRWLNAVPDTQVMNAYGPTECADDVTHYNVAPRSEFYAANVALGRPVSNTRIYILDEMFNPVPLGAAGEICVGGIGVGRGYVVEPEKTAQSYLPDPFGGTGTRLYRTGDVGRYGKGGEIEYLGRIDQQVKIRGYRIELGEIEAALHEHPSIDQAVVVARGEEEGGKRLVAYLVAEEQLSRNDLKEYLKERLPDYMVPALMVQLEELPLTANGKIDRQALPKPEAGVEVQYAGPHTEVEEILCGIWAEVLRVEKVGIHDNFFDLGGNSLSAFRVISRIRRALDVEVPLLSLFETGTISEFAKRIEGSKQSIPHRRITRVDRNAFRAG